jgi:hypothetical protein
MDYQLVTGGPDVADHLVFTTSFSHKNIFTKQRLPKPFPGTDNLRAPTMCCFNRVKARNA